MVGDWEGEEGTEGVFLFSLYSGVSISSGRLWAPAAVVIWWERGRGRLLEFQPWLYSSKCSSLVSGEQAPGL